MRDHAPTIASGEILKAWGIDSESPDAEAVVITESEARRGGEGPVVLFADDDWERLAQALAVTVPSSQVLVLLYPDASAPTRGVLRSNVRIVRVENQVGAHRAIASVNPVMVVLDALRRADAHRRLLFDLFIASVRDGGVYALLSGEDGLPVSLRAHVLEALDADQEDADSCAGALSARTVTCGRRTLVVRKVGTDRVKLRHGETDEVLSARYGSEWGEPIWATPPTSVTQHVISYTNRPDLVKRRFPEVIRVPDREVRAYRNTVVCPRQIVYRDGLYLPDTFRLGSATRLSTTALRDVNHYYAREPEVRIPEHLDGVYFNLDLEYNRHFGHFMTEAVPRLYGWTKAKEKYPDIKLVTSRRAGAKAIPDYQRTLLSAFGIDEDDMVVIDRPTEVDVLVAAAPLFENMAFSHPLLLNTFERLADGLITMSDGAGDAGSKIFVARQPGLWRECVNYEALEARFLDWGFNVVRPELLPLPQQAAMFRGAEVIAGYIGSSLYNMMFSRPGVDVVGFVNTSYVATNEFLFSSVMGNRMHLFFGEDVRGGRDRDVNGRPLAPTNCDYVVDIDSISPVLESVI